jgi:hypothetical protein
MALLGTITKQPREILDFDVDYSTVLGSRTSTLTTATSEVAPAGLNLTSTTVYAPQKKVKVVISGGTDATTYKVTVLTNTDDGLKYEDEITVIVEEV